MNVETTRMDLTLPGGGPTAAACALLAVLQPPAAALAAHAAAGRGERHRGSGGRSQRKGSARQRYVRVAPLVSEAQCDRIVAHLAHAGGAALPASRIAQATGVTRTNIYPLLERLAERGKVRASGGFPRRWSLADGAQQDAAS